MSRAVTTNGYLGPRFDAEWYATRYRGRLGGLAPLAHYLSAGRSAGCKPNALILGHVTPRDPLTFTPTDLDNERALILDVGVFDHAWYAYVHDLPAERSLQHYLIEGAYQGLDPSPFFSTECYYRDHPAIAAAGTNALWHFILFGSEVRQNGGSRSRVPVQLAFDEDIWRSGFAAGAIATANST